MARFKRCITCRRLWNISLQQKIPGSGYECPHCSSKRKQALRSGNSLKAQRKIYLSA